MQIKLLSSDTHCDQLVVYRQRQIRKSRNEKKGLCKDATVFIATKRYVFRKCKCPVQIYNSGPKSTQPRRFTVDTLRRSRKAAGGIVLCITKGERKKGGAKRVAIHDWRGWITFRLSFRAGNKRLTQTTRCCFIHVWGVQPSRFEGEYLSFCTFPIFVCHQKANGCEKVAQTLHTWRNGKRGRVKEKKEYSVCDN